MFTWCEAFACVSDRCDLTGFALICQYVSTVGWILSYLDDI